MDFCAVREVWRKGWILLTDYFLQGLFLSLSSLHYNWFVFACKLRIYSKYNFKSKFKTRYRRAIVLRKYMCHYITDLFTYLVHC